jgi:N-formylglutamate amidohydrolase
VILHVPHASRVLTRAARERILLDDAALSAELDRMTDAHTDLIARRVAAAAGMAPWTFVNRYSRLVVDPERFPDDREEMAAVGMGAVYTHTSHGERLRAEDPDHARDLLATHFEPYASAVADLVDDRLAATGRAVLVDVHSYPSRPLPYELHGSGPRPAICLGTDPDHTPAGLLDAARQVLAPCGEIGVNTPFAGCYVPLRHHRRRRAVAALMVEIRRDTYLTEPAGPLTAGLDALVEALTRLLDGVALFHDRGR